MVHRLLGIARHQLLTQHTHPFTRVLQARISATLCFYSLGVLRTAYCPGRLMKVFTQCFSRPHLSSFIVSSHAHKIIFCACHRSAVCCCSFDLTEVLFGRTEVLSGRIVGPFGRMGHPGVSSGSSSGRLEASGRTSARTVGSFSVHQV